MASIREHGDPRPPAFALIRGNRSRAWAVRHNVPDDVATELGRLADSEPHPRDLRDPPEHADRYAELVGGGDVFNGPAFVFPVRIDEPDGVVGVETREQGAPAFAVMDGDRIASLCGSSRDGVDAAEAGLVTYEPYRGRGYAARVTAAWARAIRTSGRIPLYSTSWTNAASLAVARKLNLIPYASDWSITDREG